MSRSSSQLLYLTSQEVREICRQIDVVALIREVLRLHGSGETVLPDEAYLTWNTGKTESVRSLNMPARVGGSFDAVGTKIINSNPRNSARGLPRASGLTLLFDSVTGQVVCIMEGAHISALRTAAVSLLSVELLTGHPVKNLAIIGAGVIGSTHVELAAKTLPFLERIVLFDNDSRVAEARVRALMPLLGNGIGINPAESALKAVQGADVVIAATTTTTGYIPYAWLKRGVIVVNVSLDDLLADAFLRSDLIFVDDWNLIKTDSRRLLGKLYRQGLVKGPNDLLRNETIRKVDGEISDLLLGRHSGRKSLEDIIVVNPFGLGIEDVALAARVFEIAKTDGDGQYLPR